MQNISQSLSKVLSAQREVSEGQSAQRVRTFVCHVRCHL